MISEDKSKKIKVGKKIGNVIKQCNVCKDKFVQKFINKQNFDYENDLCEDCQIKILEILKND